MDRDRALTVLRRLRGPLRARGIARAALFGSLARNRNTAASDVDVLIAPEAGQRLDLVDLGGVQGLLEDAFGCDVDIVLEPVRNPELQLTIERDRADAF